MLVLLAAACFAFALVFTMGASDVYILEGKKKAHRELAKAAACAIVGVFLIIISI